jgi:hypothetical protein
MARRWLPSTTPLRITLLGALFLVAGTTAHPIPVLGQENGLRSRFKGLFTFPSAGDSKCDDDVLFCLVSGAQSPDVAQRAFANNASDVVEELVSYLQGAIALGLSTVPAPSAGSGEAFRLSPLGVPVRNEETSLGPILAERSLTLGRGQFLIGANVTDLRFERLRGESLESLEFSVVQEDFPPAGLGDPSIERTYVLVKTRMAFEARMANLFMTAGVTDRLDVSVLVPVIQATMSGYSDAEIIAAGGGDPAAGFSFGGPPEDPKLVERSETVRAKATGLGDASVQGKLRLTDADSRFGMALLSGIRVPTGNEEDFMGSEGWSVQGLGVFSTTPFAGFSPHLNIGGVYRSAEGERSAVFGALGFDHRASTRLTIAGEILAQLPFGENPLVQSEATIDTGETLISVPSSNLPTLDDYQFDGAFGFKFGLGKFAVIGNAIVPLNDGGLRGDVLWTVGLQGGF